jgi:hypothetical protein
MVEFADADSSRGVSRARGELGGTWEAEACIISELGLMV